MMCSIVSFDFASSRVAMLSKKTCLCVCERNTKERMLIKIKLSATYNRRVVGLVGLASSGFGRLGLVSLDRLAIVGRLVQGGRTRI